MAIVVPTPNTVITSVWGKSIADALNAVYVQAGTFSGTTDVNGELVITFPVAFPTAPTVTTTLTATAVGNYAVVIHHPYGANPTTIRIRLLYQSAVHPNTAVTGTWIAVGTRP